MKNPYRLQYTVIHEEFVIEFTIVLKDFDLIVIYYTSCCLLEIHSHMEIHKEESF